MPDYPSIRPPVSRSLGIAVPVTSRPAQPVGTRCPRCRGHILPGEPGCIDCAIDRGERHGWLTLEEMGLGRPAPREKPVKKPKPSVIPNHLADAAVALHRAGQSTAEIADRIDASRQQVAQWIKHRAPR